MATDIGKILHQLRNFAANHGNLARRVSDYLDNTGTFKKDEMKELCNLAKQTSEKMRSLIDELEEAVKKA